MNPPNFTPLVRTLLAYARLCRLLPKGRKNGGVWSMISIIPELHSPIPAYAPTRSLSRSLHRSSNCRTDKRDCRFSGVNTELSFTCFCNISQVTSSSSRHCYEVFCCQLCHHLYSLSSFLLCFFVFFRMNIFVLFYPFLHLSL